MTEKTIKLAKRINNLAKAIIKLDDESLLELEELIKDNQGLEASVSIINDLLEAQ